MYIIIQVVQQNWLLILSITGENYQSDSVKSHLFYETSLRCIHTSISLSKVCILPDLAKLFSQQ